LKKKAQQQQPPPRSPRSPQPQPEVETIIVETVEDEYYGYMCKDETQKQIDLFDNFHDKDAIWNYIETVW
jgi:hypothetical protein